MQATLTSNPNTATRGSRKPDTTSPDVAEAGRSANRALMAAGLSALAPKVRGPLEQRCYDRRVANLIGIEAEAEAAAGSAATAKERGLIEAIYAAIPDCVAKCQAHADAETFNDPNEPAIDRAWCRARDAIFAKLERFMDLPACGAAHGLRRIELFARVRVLLDYADPGGDVLGGDVLGGDLFEDDLRQIAETAIAALKSATLPPKGSPRWTAARAAYETASEEAAALRVRVSAAEEELAASHPIPTTLQLGPGRWYFRAENIHRDASSPWHGPTLTEAEAAEKLAALAAFLPGYEAEVARLGLGDGPLEKAYDAAMDRMRLAADRLMNTPAPPEAAAYKLEVLFVEYLTGPDEALGGSDLAEWAAARVLLDLRRAATAESPKREAA